MVKKSALVLYCSCWEDDGLLGPQPTGILGWKPSTWKKDSFISAGMEGILTEFASIMVLLVLVVMGAGGTVFTGGDEQTLRLKELAYKDFAMVNRLKALAVDREASPSSEVLSMINEYIRFLKSSIS